MVLRSTRNIIVHSRSPLLETVNLYPSVMANPGAALVKLAMSGLVVVGIAAAMDLVVCCGSSPSSSEGSVFSMCCSFHARIEENNS